MRHLKPLSACSLDAHRKLVCCCIAVFDPGSSGLFARREDGEMIVIVWFKRACKHAHARARTHTHTQTHTYTHTQVDMQTTSHAGRAARVSNPLAHIEAQSLLDLDDPQDSDDLLLPVHSLNADLQQQQQQQQHFQQQGLEGVGHRVKLPSSTGEWDWSLSRASSSP
eukprot:1156017-Pelagomonas_calceolata.AAC.8